MPWVRANHSSKRSSVWFIGVVTLVLLCCGSRLGAAATVTLAWDRNPETNIAGYIVSYGTSSRAYSTSVDVGNATMWSLSVGTGTYYFAVQAYDTSGMRSAFSAEVSKTLQDPELTPAPTPATTDVALNRPVVSSSDYSSQYAAAYAVDGNTSTEWSSQFSDPQWFYVDLGQRFAISEVKLTWDAAAYRSGLSNPGLQ